MPKYSPKNTLFHPISGPLWLVIQRYFGNNDMGPGYTWFLAGLYRLAHELGEDVGETLPRSGVPLSSEQEKSFWILWTWWKSYRAQCEVQKDWPPTEFVRHVAGGRSYEFHLTSPYFRKILHLFEKEFGGPGFETDEGFIKYKRKDGAIYSACQNIAMACYTHALEEGRLLPSPLLEHDRLAFTVPAQSHQKRILHEDDLPGLDSRCSTGASLGSCPWLQSPSGLPFYLWDVKTKQTVEVDTLDFQPKYTAISHTWGRWKTEGPLQRVKGVKDWLVPPNSLFDVGALPQILERVPVMTPYVWFDLVCIPQNRSARAVEEISRQATIFKNATHAVVWLNRIAEWSTIRSALEWMSLAYLGVEDQGHDGPEDGPTGLFEEYTYGVNVRRSQMRVAGWFSSLWTLQEICLRPDMWLANRDWELLTVGHGVPISFDTLVALTQECSETLSSHLHALEAWNLDDMKYEGAAHLHLPSFNTPLSKALPDERLSTFIRHGKYPRAFLELSELFDRIGMEDLHTLRRVHILLLGSQRHCQDSRAEAIMSVLGVTQWDRQDPSFILGTYPLQFIRHVSEELGASFFATQSSREISFEAMARSSESFPRGSLLPFTLDFAQPVEYKTISKLDYSNEVYHPTVASWIIHRDGSVQISKAAILASTNDCTGPELECGVLLTYDDTFEAEPQHQGNDQRNLRLYTVDIRKWVRKYLPGTATFAVELCRSHLTGFDQPLSRGLLLKEMAQGSNIMVKVGNYFTNARTIPEGGLPGTPTREVGLSSATS